MDITVDQIITEMRKCEESNGDDMGMTTDQICAATGLSSRPVLAMLKREVLAGRVTVQREIRPTPLRPGHRGLPHNIYRVVG